MPHRKPKPRELLELRPAADLLFEVLREQFDVPEVYELGLGSLEHHQQVPLDLAAYAMWQVRIMHRLTAPGVITTSETVITVCHQLAYHLDLLAAEAADLDGQDVMLRIREDLRTVARVTAALDGAPDGPPCELY